MSTVPPVRALAILGASLALLSVGFLAGRGWAKRTEPVFRPLTFRQGFVFSARFTNDGASVVYGAAWEGEPSRVFTSPVDRPDPRPLDVPPADVFAASRRGDLLLGLGRSFRFDWLTGAALATTPPGGGPPRILRDLVRAADWATDGEAIALVRPDKRGHALEFPAGTVLHRTSGWIGDVRVLPDGIRVAFLDHPVWGDRRGRLLVAGKGEVRALLPQEFETLTGLAVAPGGREGLFSATRSGSQTEIQAVSADGGPARPVLRAPGALRVHDAAGGRLLVSREEQRQTLGFRRGAELERDLCWTSHAQVAALSADGNRAVITVYDDRGGGNGTAWLRGTDGSAPIPLGAGDATDLSPDGRWAVVIRHGEIDTLALLPTVPGEGRTLVLPRVERYHWARFTPDGRGIVLSANEKGRKIRLYRLDLATGDSAPVTPEGVGYLLSLTSKGDAVTSEDLDRKLRLFPLEGGSPRDIAGLLPSENVLIWLPGDEAYLAAMPNDVPLRVFHVDARTGERRLHAEVGPPDRNGLRSLWPVAFSRDGSAVAYTVSRLFSELFVVEGVR
ncbi:MAG TPA: WD40 repeat domain-containing protein [Thermoanaerobaculia bacterium]|nr:WD40 repeat domain-containing protein [Thermoanaerobaculia bacterium]